TTRLLQCIFFIIPTPPRYTLFPYTTLFRSPVSKMTRQRLSVISVHLHPPYHFLRGLPHRVVEVRAIYGIRRVDRRPGGSAIGDRSEEHTSELQSRFDLVCRLLLEKKKHSIF